MIESLVKELGIRCPYTEGKETKQGAQERYHRLEARIRADERRLVLQGLAIKLLQKESRMSETNNLATVKGTIGYHTRLDESDATLIQRSIFGGKLDQGTVEQLVNTNFEVEVLNSGRAVFVDSRGRRVRLYLSVLPEHTEKGRAAYAMWQEQERKRREAEAGWQQLREELEAMIDLLGPALSLAKLKEE